MARRPWLLDAEGVVDAEAEVADEVVEVEVLEEEGAVDRVEDIAGAAVCRGLRHRRVVHLHSARPPGHPVGCHGRRVAVWLEVVWLAAVLGRGISVEAEPAGDLQV